MFAEIWEPNFRTKTAIIEAGSEVAFQAFAATYQAGYITPRPVIIPLLTHTPPAKLCMTGW